MMKILKALFKRKSQLQDLVFKTARENAQLKHANARLDELWAKTTVDLLAEEAKVRDLNRDLIFWKEKCDGLESANSILQQGCYRAESQLKSASFKLDASQEDVSSLKRALHSARAELAIKSAPESKLHAFVMSLRVHEMQGTEGQRGYGVTAFIPQGVLEALQKADRETKRQFVQVIATDLVSRALHGMWYINSRGNRCALIFDPMTGGAAGVVFDTPNGPEMKLARATGTATNNLQLLSQHPEAAAKFHKSISRAEALDEAAWLTAQANRTTLPGDKGDAIKLMIAAAKLPREAGE